MKKKKKLLNVVLNNLPALNLFTLVVLIVSYQLYRFSGIFVSALLIFFLVSKLTSDELIAEFLVLLLVYVVLVSLNALNIELKNRHLPAISEGSSVSGTVVKITESGVFLESCSGKIFVRFSDYERFLYSLASVSTTNFEQSSKLAQRVKDFEKITKYAAVEFKVERIVKKRVLKGFIEEPWIVYGKLKLRPQPDPFSAFLWKLQQRVDCVLTERAGIFEGKVLKGFLTGEKPYANDYVLVNLKRTGSLHLLAVSGLHIGILYLMLDRIPNLLRISDSLIFFSILKVVLLAGFLLFVGLPSSGVRAFVMILLYELSKMFLRNSKLHDILFAASTLILLVNPSVIFDIAFQLSFLSVCGISSGIYMFERYRNQRKNRAKYVKSLSYRWYKKTKENLTYSAFILTGIQIFLLPLNIYYFKGFSFLGAIANLFVVPLAGSILTASVLTLVLDSLSLNKLAAFSGSLSKFLLLFLLKICSFFSRLPASYIYLDLRGFEASFQLREVLLLLLASVFALVIYKVGAKSQAIMLAGILIFLLFNAVFNREKDGAVLLDVGQGTSLAAFSKEKTFLFDCGPPSARVYEKLLQSGLALPEQIFISHYHLDHIGGLPPLLSAFRFVKNGKVWLPPPQTSFEKEVYQFFFEVIGKEGIEFHRIKNGLEASDCSTNLSLTVFDFSKEMKNSDPNSRSAVFLISFKNTGCSQALKDRVNILYPSDCYSSTLQRFNPEIVKLVIAPHHGSLNGYSENFYKNFRGEVLISCGKNPYGLPSKELIEMLKSLNIRVRQTMQEGSIYWKPH